MEIKLENLIEQIKKDGIEEAKRSSEEIIGKAEAEARRIVEDARLKAEEVQAQLQEEAKKIKRNTASSLKQAVRDSVLALKGELTGVFDRILKESLSKELTPYFIKELVTKIVDKWSGEGKVTLEVLASKADREKLAKLLFSKLREEAEETIELKVSSAVNKGFRIGVKGEDLYYDFTEESILESLKEFLNPTISSILNAEDK